MKLLIFRRKNFRRIDLTLLILFIIISMASTLSSKDFFLDLDDDTHLSAWIESIEFTKKEIFEDNYNSNITTFVTYIEFTIDLEIWNPGPFRISYQSRSGAYGFPKLITQSGNSTFILTESVIMENDVGAIQAIATSIYPGIHHYQWEGGILIFNGSVPDSNPYLPDGDYRFKFGNDQWIKSDIYYINVSNGIHSHIHSEKPLLWGESTINLGNPLWYLIGIPLIALILIEWRINVKKGLPLKENP